MIVVDASVIVEVVLGEDEGVLLAQLIRETGEAAAAPHVLDLEVAQAVRRLARLGQLSPDSGHDALTLVARLPITRYSHEPLLDRIWQLRANVSAYDASYIALAEGLDATLFTRDARLAAAPGIRSRIELL